jgi:tetratricopeptide (TPR) repeat protein
MPCFGPGAAFAASSTSGGTESVFALGAGSRALGMGGAFTAVSDDATALYWNPAGLSDVAQTGLTGFHSTLFEGSSYDFFSICQPTVRFGGFGFAFLRVGTDGIHAYDGRSASLGDIGFSQTEMLFSYGRGLPFRSPFNVRLGTSIKVVSQRMGDSGADGVGVDFGALYPVPFVKGLSVGVALRDMPGARLKLVEKVERTPGSIRFGTSYRGSLRSAQDALLFGLDVSLPKVAPAAVSVGGEYVISQTVALRAGLKEGKLAAGAGVKWRNYSFDYSLSNTELGNLHQFSVSASFGDPVGVKMQREKLDRERDVARMLSQEKADRKEAHLRLAREAFGQGNYSSSVEEWALVLEYDPENVEAKTSIVKAREALARKTDEEAAVVERHAKARWLVELAAEHVGNGELSAASLRLAQAAQTDSTNADAIAGIARVDSLIAVEAASRAAEARRHAGSGKHLEASLAWNRVLLLDPDNADAKRGLDAATTAMKGVGESLTEANLRIEALTQYSRAVRAYETGDYKEAKARIQDMLKILPSDPDGRRLAEMIDERLSPLVKKVEENIRRLYVEGMNHFNSGEYEKAIESWKKILALDPQNEMVAKNIEKARARLSSGERNAD